MRRGFLAGGVCALFVSLLLTVSCTEPIDIDAAQSGGRVVIFSVLMDGGVYMQRVSVQRTVPYFSPAGTVDWVDDAVVEISASTGQTYPARWDEVIKEYVVERAFEPQVGVTYTLDVEVDGVKYSAQTTVLEPVAFDRIEIEPVPHEVVQFTDLDVFQVKLYGQDPPGRNFYIFRIAVDGEIRNAVDDWMYMGDRMFQDGAINGVRFMNFLGEPDPEAAVEDEEGYWWAGPGQRISILTSNVSKEFMDFVADVQPSSGGGNPLFGGPPHNVGSNFSGGALGFFGALRSTVLSDVVPEHD